MPIKNDFIQFLLSNYPELNQQETHKLISDELISPFKLQLPLSILQDIQTQIKQLYQLRNWSADNLNENFKKFNLPTPQLKSVCTSYDFHVNPENQIKLIEINTNAAFLTLGTLLYEFWNQNPQTQFNTQSIIQMFQNEIQLAKANPNAISIIDEKPEEQRLYIEFLVLQQLCLKNKIHCDIVDIDSVDQIPQNNLVYNRYTDFYLQNEKSFKLNQRYKNKNLHLSPSPWEYFLIADKQRMFDWQKQTSLNKPDSLLKIEDLATADKETIWQNRKHLFFKPKSSFGSKQVYKGASVSKKIFDEAFQQEFIAQEFCAPNEVNYNFNNEDISFKYDLRCYAYEDQLQLVIARLYKGQTTNLKTLGGGFTVIDWIK